MFDYLLDSNYREAKAAYNDAKQNVRKLEKIEKNLTNDTSSVNKINRKLDDIYDEFANMIKNSNVRNQVSQKLDAMREKNQNVDSYLTNACECIEREKRLLFSKMDRQEQKMNRIVRDSKED